LQAPEQHAGIALDADVIDPGVFLGQFHNKTALAHTDFDLDGIGVAEQQVPAAFLRLRVLHDVGARRNRFLGAGNVA
jgi:hypothetical protein